MAINKLVHMPFIHVQVNCKVIPRFRIMVRRIYAFVNLTNIAQNISQWRVKYFILPPAIYEYLCMFYIYFYSLFLVFIYKYCYHIFNMKELAFSFFYWVWLLKFEQTHMKIEKFSEKKGKFNHLRGM